MRLVEARGASGQKGGGYVQMREFDRSSRIPFELGAGRNDGQRPVRNGSRTHRAVAASFDMLRATEVLHDVVMVEARLLHHRRGARPMPQQCRVPRAGLARQIGTARQLCGPVVRRGEGDDACAHDRATRRKVEASCQLTRTPVPKWPETLDSPLTRAPYGTGISSTRRAAFAARICISRFHP